MIADLATVATKLVSEFTEADEGGDLRSRSIRKREERPSGWQHLDRDLGNNGAIGNG
jgi:hypothetical protein